MRKDRFYLEDFSGHRISSLNSVHKIKNVLRKKAGDTIYVFDGRGREYEAFIRGFGPEGVFLEIGKCVKKADTPFFTISLGFSLLKSQKADFVFQKSVELGADEFVPFLSHNSVTKHPGPGKIIRWQRIIQEAVCQSQRLFVPKFSQIYSWPGLVSSFNKYDFVLVADPDARAGISSCLRPETVMEGGKLLLLVGPEGGFSREEKRDLFLNNNALPVRLSNYVLRSETAAVFFVGLAAALLNRDVNES